MAHGADKTERMGLAAERLIAAGYGSKARDLAREYGTEAWVAACDDGADVAYPYATTRREAAEECVEDGSWGDPCEATTWVTVTTWQRWTLGNSEFDDCDSAADIKVAIEPEEPECAEGNDHEWGDDPDHHDYLHGAGMVMHSRCRYCGAVAITDTYAQDRFDGEQGLTSVRYDLDDHDTSGPAGAADKPDSEYDYEAVDSYVSTFPSDRHPMGEGAADVMVGVASAGEGWRKRWYVSTWDDAGGSDEADDSAYETEDEAIEAAKALAAEKDEGNGKESAEDYLRRQLAEAAGDQDPRGAWGISTDGEYPEERYASQEQAEAACALAECALDDRYRGTRRLIAYGVIHRVAGQWVEVDTDDDEEA